MKSRIKPDPRRERAAATARPAPEGRSPLSSAVREAALCGFALALSAGLFALSFPNPLIERGLPLLAWLAYAPVFWVIRRSRLPVCVLWGALYGFTSYSLFNYWLAAFHPLAAIIVNTLYLGYFALFFPLLRLALLLFPRLGPFVQGLLWISFEYVRTLGFLGYPYGISGYSQWSVLPVIQIASVFGVWGVCALVIYASILAERLLCAFFPALNASGRASPPRAAPRPLSRPLLAASAVYLALLGAALVYGALSPLDYAENPSAKIALVQHNTDPWRGGLVEYRQNYQVLKRLSNEALRETPDLDLVVWSETAFVPRIYWHQTYRDDQESYALVKELLDYLKAQDVPFVLGNDDARRELSPQGRQERVDYNAVMLFDRGELAGVYRKTHLVPFTEHFPYKELLPRPLWLPGELIYNWLLAADTHLWKPGEDEHVFTSRGLRFASPICFEDTFGYLSRRFVLRGADLLVNLSNDAWSKSLPAQWQHFGMAVFRAVENRRALVRSTASGQTGAIDPNGRLLAIAPPFTEASLTVTVPVVSAQTALTPYTRWGDWLPRLTLALTLALFLAAALRRLLSPAPKA